MIKNIASQLARMRKSFGLTQGELAERAGINRMTVQRLEAGAIDPRLSSVMELARALDMELMLVPSALRQEVEGFLRSGGRILGQPAGTQAPRSIVDLLTSDPAAPQESRFQRVEKKP